MHVTFSHQRRFCDKRLLTMEAFRLRRNRLTEGKAFSNQSPEGTAASCTDASDERKKEDTTFSCCKSGPKFRISWAVGSKGVHCTKLGAFKCYLSGAASGLRMPTTEWGFSKTFEHRHGRVSPIPGFQARMS